MRCSRTACLPRSSAGHGSFTAVPPRALRGCGRGGSGLCPPPRRAGGPGGRDATFLQARLRLSNSVAARLRIAADAPRWAGPPELPAARALLYRLGPKPFRDAVLAAWSRCKGGEDMHAWRTVYALPDAWTPPDFPPRWLGRSSGGCRARPRDGSGSATSGRGLDRERLHVDARGPPGAPARLNQFSQSAISAAPLHLDRLVALHGELALEREAGVLRRRNVGAGRQDVLGSAPTLSFTISPWRV